MRVENYHTSNILKKIYISEKNAKIAHRIQGIYLASKGLTCPEIVNATGFSRRTIQQWIAKYNTSGIDALKDLPRSGQPSKLSKQQEIALLKRIQAGPTKAENSNPQLQAEFKKTSSRRWIKSNQSI